MTFPYVKYLYLLFTNPIWFKNNPEVSCLHIIAPSKEEITVITLNMRESSQLFTCTLSPLNYGNKNDCVILKNNYLVLFRSCTSFLYPFPVFSLILHFLK